MKNKSFILSLAVTLAVFVWVLLPGRAFAFADTCASGGANNVCATSCTYTARDSSNSKYSVHLDSSYCCSHGFSEADVCNIGAAEVGAKAGSGSWNQACGNAWGTWSGTLTSQTATCGSATTNPSASFPSAATACNTGTLEGTSATGWFAPTVGTKVADGGATIVPNNALTSNNVYTVFDNNLDTVDYTNLGISVPAGATIVGIEFSLEGQKSGARTLNLSISPNNGASFTAVKNLGSTFTSSDKTSIAGSAADTWGRTWTPSEFANGSLRLRLTSAASTGSISIDQVKIQVSYTTAVTNATTFSWNCLGTGSGADAACTGPRTVAGVCGSATTVASYSLPSGAAACSVGSMSSTLDTGSLAPTVGTKVADGGATIVPNNALTSNNVYTVFDNNSDVADYSSFGMSVPTSSTIKGIEVYLEGNKSGSGSRTIKASMSSNSGTSFTATKDSGIFSTSDATTTLGSATDTWGRTWSSTDFSNGNFKLRLAASTVSGTTNIDQAKVKVYYTASTAVGTTFSWTCTGVNSGASVTCIGPKIIDGVCSYPPAGQSTYNAPTASCNVGTPSLVTLSGTFPSQTYRWTCSSTNGGGIPTCIAPKDACASGQTLCSITNTCINNGAACIGPGIKIDNFYFKPDIGSTALSGKCPVLWATSLTGTSVDPSLVLCSLNGASVASTSPVGLTQSPGLYNLSCTYNNLSTTATSSSAKCGSSPTYVEN